MRRIWIWLSQRKLLKKKTEDEEKKRQIHEKKKYYFCFASLHKTTHALTYHSNIVLYIICFYLFIDLFIWEKFFNKNVISFFMVNDDKEGDDIVEM